MIRSTNPGRRIDTDTLKRERPLADVIASYGITLRCESAGTYRALCPFHQERTASFWIDARDSLSEHYFCFGCTSNGDVITFVMEREGCSFQEACERLSTRSRPPTLEPAQQRTAAPAGGRRWEDLPADSAEARVLDLALQVYQAELWRNARAQAYLRSRAVPEDVARTQRLGYAAGGALLRWLKQESNADLLPVAVTLGLVQERPGAEDDKPVYREFFFDRLIIAELRQGRPIWCIGRAIEDPPTRAATEAPVGGSPLPPVRPRPKYLGLPGEKPVIGLEHVVGRHVAYITEGPVDWLAAVAWQLPAFAICGTHFPTKRLPALAEALAIYGVFDPDRAGQSAAERFAPLFGSRWRPVQLPNSLDLAELAALGAAGREAFDILVGRARATAWQQSRF